MKTIFQHRSPISVPAGFILRLSAIFLIAFALSVSIPDSIARLASASGIGAAAAGLRGEYFDNVDFTDLKLTRTDPAIDFNWGFGSPDPSINQESFSIRWTGQVAAPVSGNYIFVTRSDDGVRLWVGNQLLIDNFTPHPETEDRSVAVALDAAQSRDLRLEYFEMTANAVIRLMWIRPGQTNPEVIPSTALSTPVTPNPVPEVTGINPSTVPANSGAFTLTVLGSNFLQGAMVQWNNAARPTSFVSSALLTASIQAGDLQEAGIVNITVVNPMPGGGTSNPVQLTVSDGIEADVAPRPNGSNNGLITIADWTQIGRFSARLDVANNGAEFQRADCAPRITLGDGRISLTDWVQGGRYASALDPVTPAGGPSSPSPNVTTDPSNEPNDNSNHDPSRHRFIFNPIEALLAGIFDFSKIEERDRSVVIACPAAGSENALAFSVRFDPLQWQYISAASGFDAPGAAVFANARMAANGSVGFAMALPPGRKFAAGRRRIAVLTFRPRSGKIAASPPVIQFADSPIAQEAVDANANCLIPRFAFEALAPGGGAISLLRRR
jgi:hypothetical protein